MFPQGAPAPTGPQSSPLLAALGASGPGAMDPMAMMSMGMGGMGGQQPGMMAMAGQSPMGDPSMNSPMGPQMPPGLEGLSPQEIQAILALLSQYGMPTQGLEELGGLGQPSQAGAMAPVTSGQDMDLAPGAAYAPARSYGPFGG